MLFGHFWGGGRELTHERSDPVSQFLATSAMFSIGIPHRPPRHSISICLLDSKVHEPLAERRHRGVMPVDDGGHPGHKT
jgi:hypothetical protein